MIRRTVRWCLYLTWALLLYALQSSLGDRIMIYGIRPDLMPFLVCACAALEGKKKGAWFGFFVGLLCDAFHPISTGFFPVLYFFCAYFTGVLTERHFDTNILTVGFFGICASVIGNFLQYVVFYMIFLRVPAADMLYITGMEAVYSLLLSALAYLPMKLSAHLTRDTRGEYRKVRC